MSPTESPPAPTSDRLLRLAAVAAGLGVALGAFGAHALRETLEARGTTGIWETAVLYHLVHAVAAAALALTGRKPGGPGWLWLAGVLLFSGSLYGLALGGPRLLGPVTPLGGLAFLGGWAWLALAPRR